ncbi:calcium-binding protein [Tropicibacter naphthalenivorans]|uniref:Hemolysin, chromosomal n=1 Tax=Tropicibacter naphthalenivorans TaxID=441103 RepID=A0A0P1GNR7_9RHOB|nr:calcium-binding protein [Tropicibacter naphthalenivorans]CUH77490.1 Hemolysin, chromosomal [Tropicibacter naphthalenivorans]SMC56869.1 Hemolysin-type calcium-binding repeat-containing protein [Tropicibacter naphthalenivorans]
MTVYSFTVSAYAAEAVTLTFGPDLIEVGLTGVGFQLSDDGALIGGQIATTRYAVPVTINSALQLVTCHEGALATPFKLNPVPEHYDGPSPMQSATGLAFYQFHAAFEQAWAGTLPSGLAVVGTGADDITARAVADTLVVAGGTRVLARDGDDRVLVADPLGARVYGNGGNDTLGGGAGRDTLAGNRGDDLIEGRAGRDYLFGGTGDDWVDGGTGDDFVYGGTGADTLLGGAGNDRLLGHSDGDTLSGGAGNDTVAGLTGNDFLEGGAGDDVLLGGFGNDMLMAQTGRDVLCGGAGADAFVLLLPAETPSAGHATEVTDTAIVMDFDLAEDILWLSPHQNASYTAADAMALFRAHAYQDGTQVIYDDGISQVKIRDLDLDDLTIGHFTHGEGYHSWTDPA